MGRVGLMVRAVPVTLMVLHVAVLVPDAMVHPVLTAVRGHPVIANLARSATMLLAIMTRPLTPTHFQQNLTVPHGVS